MKTARRSLATIARLAILEARATELQFQGTFWTPADLAEAEAIAREIHTLTGGR